MSLMACFIDHSMVQAERLAQLAHEKKPWQTKCADAGLLLIVTCLRLEIYGDANVIPRYADQLFGSEFSTIDDQVEIAERIAGIAAGLYSHVLGEAYIFEQVQTAVHRVPLHHEIRMVADRALDVAKVVRRNNGFVSKLSYDDIAFKLLLDQKEFEVGRCSLFVIGGGMLGQSILKHAATEAFSHIYGVSRNPKTLRRRLKHLGEEMPMVLRAEDCRDIEGNYCCILATTDVDAVYASEIANVVSASRCVKAVDLSSIPVLLDRKANYIDLYSPSFLACVSENNAAMMHMSEPVRLEIKNETASISISI